MPYCRSHVAYPGAAGGRWTARDRARARGAGSVASAVMSEPHATNSPRRVNYRAVSI